MRLAQHLDKLESFVVIAELKKMNEASKQVGLTQPSLSRLVDTLEECVGARLFIRGRSGCQLTAAGEQLFAYAKSILGPIKDVEEKIKNPDSVDSGHLRVGSYETLAEYLWPDFIRYMKKKYPNLSLNLRTSQSLNHLNSLVNKDLDVIIDSEARLSGEFDSFPIYGDEFGFFVSKTTLNKTPVLSLPVIYVPSATDAGGKSLYQYIGESELVNNDRIELDSFITVKTFCEKNIGIAILPIRLTSDSRNKNLVRLSPPGLAKKFGKHTIYATMRSERIENRQIRILIKSLKSWMSQRA